MKALGAYIFAGGFTVGVRKHFDVVGHLEGSSYGVSTARLNFPGLPIHWPKTSWPTDEYRKRKVDFGFANPPCAVFSTMGIATTRGQGAWMEDPRTECWWDAYELFAEQLNVPLFAIESVCQAYGTGRPLIDELTRRALGIGYSVTHLFVDAANHGIPQHRKRFFFVAHRAIRLVGLSSLNWAPPPTIGDVLGSIERGRGGPANPLGDRFLHYLRNTPQGERVSNTWVAEHPEETWVRNAQGKVTGRPSFGDRRLHPGEQMGAFIGDKFYHPTEHRRLSEQEMKAVCGYPDDFALDGPIGGRGSLLARAVMPPVAEFVARAARATLESGARSKHGTRTVFRADLRKPEIAPVDLTSDYLEGGGDLKAATRMSRPSPKPKEDPVPKRPQTPAQDELPFDGPTVPAAPDRLRAARAAALKGASFRVAGPIAPDSSPPRPGSEGSGIYMKRAWLAGGVTPEQLVENVLAAWPGRTTKVSDAFYNYRQMETSGLYPDLPPWPRKVRGRKEQVAVKAKAAVTSIVSGGQTGADVGGLEAGVALGLKTGGWMPAGFRTDAGNRPDMAQRFGIQAHHDRSYPPRTERNVQESDGTLVFGDPTSPGCKLTLRLCRQQSKPSHVVPWSVGSDPRLNLDAFRAWLADNSIATLNVAGNRERTNPGIGAAVTAFLVEAFRGHSVAPPAEPRQKGTIPPAVIPRSGKSLRRVLAYFSTLADRGHPSPISSARIAWFLQDHLKFDAVFHGGDPALVQFDRIDELWVVNSSWLYMRDPWRTSSTRLFRAADRVVFCLNDYAGRIHSYHEGRIRPDAHYVTLGTVEKYLGTRPGALMNWNVLTYDPKDVPSARAKPRPRDPALYYYGSFRPGREKVFQRYFSDPAFAAACRVSASRPSEEDKFRALCPDLSVVGRADVAADLTSHGATMMLEDDYSTRHYVSPPNRFYEALSAPCGMVFDRTSIPMWDRYGYDVRPYAVDGPADALGSGLTLNADDGLAREQARLWRRDYLGELRAEFDRLLPLIRKSKVGRRGPPDNCKRYTDDD